MSKGLGFLQSNIQDMLQDGDTLTVADVMEVAGPDYDPRHIRRAFKSLHRRGKVCLTVKAGCLAVKVKSLAPAAASRPVPIQGQRQVPYPAIELGRKMPLSPADAYAAKVAREVERQKKEALQGTRRTTV
jgi:hypothetical protein